MLPCTSGYVTWKRGWARTRPIPLVPPRRTHRKWPQSGGRRPQDGNEVPSLDTAGRSAVRTPNGGDYGKDLLRQHYEQFHGTTQP